MGYTGIYNAIRKDNGSIDRRATLERDFSAWENGDKKTVMLKSSMQGTTFYAAMETTCPAGREVWALVILTRTDGACFLYKEMDETEGPCYYTCPVSILNILTPTENREALQWRERCRENAEKKRKKGATIPRSATEVYVTFTADNNAAKAGESGTVYRRGSTWVYEDAKGHFWRLTTTLLHNENFLTVNGTNADKKPAESTEQEKPVETPAPVQDREETPAAQDQPEKGPENAPRKTAEKSARCYTVVVRLNDTWADIYINGKWDFGCRLYLLQHHMAGEKEYYPDAIIRYKIERGTSNRSMHRPFIDSMKARTDGRPIIDARRNKRPVQGRTGPRRAVPGRTPVNSSFCSQIEKSRPPN